jgi:hypothetical protein
LRSSHLVSARGRTHGVFLVRAMEGRALGQAIDASMFARADVAPDTDASEALTGTMADSPGSPYDCPAARLSEAFSAAGVQM